MKNNKNKLTAISILSIIIILLLVLIGIYGVESYKPYDTKHDNIVQDEENDINNSSDTACSEVCPVITNRPEGWSVSEFTSDVNVISFDDSLNYVNGTVVLYYSFNDCPWCYDGFPVFKDVANTYDVDWYYVDVQREERSADNDTYKELLNIFSSECDDTLYMPFAVFIKDGKIIGSNTGTVSSHQISDDELPVINSEQKEELKQIYISLFEEIR